MAFLVSSATASPVVGKGLVVVEASESLGQGKNTPAPQKAASTSMPSSVTTVESTSKHTAFAFDGGLVACRFAEECVKSAQAKERLID